MVDTKNLSRAENYTASLPQYLNSAQRAFITQKTPSQFIKEHPGPAGILVKYVEQVWVRGELTIKIQEHTVTKGQYGGSDIKVNRGGEPVSVADDLKAAASDCLKKCASMLGIAGDIYWRDLDNWYTYSEETISPNSKQTRSYR